MRSLGFIQKDTACADNFKQKLGSNYSWVSPIPGTEQTAEELPEEYRKYVQEKLDAKGSIIPTENPTEDGEFAAGQETQLSLDDLGNFVNYPVPSHEHDPETEGGLIAVTVLVWVAVLALIIVFVYQHMKAKKGGSAIAYSQQ